MFYLKKRDRERDKGDEKEYSLCSVYSANSQNGQDRTKPKPKARNAILLFMWMTGTQSPELVPAASKEQD